MRQWHFLQFSLHPRHLESASAIVAEMGTRGLHEQPLKSGEVLLEDLAKGEWRCLVFCL